MSEPDPMIWWSTLPAETKHNVHTTHMTDIERSTSRYAPVDDDVWWAKLPNHIRVGIMRKSAFSVPYPMTVTRSRRSKK